MAASESSAARLRVMTIRRSPRPREDLRVVERFESIAAVALQDHLRQLFATAATSVHQVQPRQCRMQLVELPFLGHSIRKRTSRSLSTTVHPAKLRVSKSPAVTGSRTDRSD